MRAPPFPPAPPSSLLGSIWQCCHLGLSFSHRSNRRLRGLPGGAVLTTNRSSQPSDRLLLVSVARWRFGLTPGLWVFTACLVCGWLLAGLVKRTEVRNELWCPLDDITRQKGLLCYSLEAEFLLLWETSVFCSEGQPATPSTAIPFTCGY